METVTVIPSRTAMRTEALAGGPAAVRAFLSRAVFEFRRRRVLRTLEWPVEAARVALHAHLAALGHPVGTLTEDQASRVVVAVVSEYLRDPHSIDAARAALYRLLACLDFPIDHLSHEQAGAIARAIVTAWDEESIGEER